MKPSFKTKTIDGVKYSKHPISLKFEAKTNKPVQYTAVIVLARQFTKALKYASMFYYTHMSTLIDSKKLKKGKYPFMSEGWLHHWIYYTLEDKFGLKAQEACSACRRVHDTYYATWKSLKYKPKQLFYDHGPHRKPTLRQTTLFDVGPLFKHCKLQAVAQNGKEWNFKGKRNFRHNSAWISLTTLRHKRTRTVYKVHIPFYFKKYFNRKHKWGTITILIHKSKHNHIHIWFNIAYTIYEPISHKIKSTNGSDRGQNNIFYTYNDKKKCLNIHGAKLSHKMAHNLHRKSILQRKGTRQAKRKIKNLTERDKCRNDNLYHILGKTLALATGYNSRLGFEQLSSIRLTLVHGSKKSKRYKRVSWAYSQLSGKTLYKLGLIMSDLVHVNPQYTSKMCPRCHHVCWTARNKDLHCFKCPFCGFYANDDKIGAMNIHLLVYYGIKHGLHYPTIVYDKYQMGHIVEGSKHYKQYKIDKKKIKAINQH